MPHRIFTFLLILLLAGRSLHAQPDARTADLCDQAMRRAALSEGVPLDVLRAIARVESGLNVAGTLRPWPWAINVEGQGLWFDTEVEAKSHVFQIFKAGARSFDIGCFQINYRWHGQAFRSIDEMFDPDQNARYAAGFLKDLFAELASWPAAAGAYHSRTPALAQTYSERFQTELARLNEDEPTSYAAVARDPFTHSSAPLLPSRSEAPKRIMLGSLVPVADSATAFIVFN